ncbi:MAG: non-canonical purine NTP pyrophosphatase [Phycisphaerales bacterium]|nr:non-canonical purine NTP pyrophosphatase [Phycisphaerales bacterium]
MWQRWWDRCSPPSFVSSVHVSDRLILATANPHKVAELRAIFALAGVEALGLADLPDPSRFVEPVEHGSTFEANARIKAASYAAQTGELCLADDSGIEIDALAMADGTPRPGVISSHYCTDGRDIDPPMSRAERDAANNARVLRELERVPVERRTARFVCCMCVCTRDGRIVAESRGTMEGRIGLPPRVPAGSNGFGYDPLFLVAPGLERTGAELASEEKNLLSHRGAAARLMAARLAGLTGSTQPPMP